MIPNLPPEWRMVRLGACLIRRKDTVMPATLPKNTINVVGLEDIEGGGNGLISIQRKKASEVDSLKTVFQKGDILYGKLRPYLNKVGIAPDTGLCSTEIWAFRTELFVDPYYAISFLSTQLFVQRASSMAKGANLPRLDTEAFDSIEIPLPPLSEQHRIVEILQEADKIRRLEALTEPKTSELIPSIFRHMFGDVNTNPMKWPIHKVAHFVKYFEGGKSLPDSGAEAPERLRVLKISAVTSGIFDPDESKSAPAGHVPEDHHYVRAGDLLISRANTAELVGASVLVGDCPPNLLLSDKLWRFLWRKPANLSPIFMAALFRMPSVRNNISRLATGTGGSMKNISKEKLMDMRVPLPPTGLQLRFAEAVREVQEIQNLFNREVNTSTLMNSLLTYAFTGELTAQWRDLHKYALEKDAAIRDDALKSSGVTLPIPKMIEQIEEMLAHRTDGAYAELTREQHIVLETIERGYGGVHSPRWFNAAEVAESMQGALHGNRHAVESHLAVLAARGLVIPVSREEQKPDTGEVVFGNACRLPLKDFEPQEGDERDPLIGDEARLREMGRLLGQLKKERLP